MPDKELILTQVRRADDLEVVIEDTCDIRSLRSFDIVGLEAGATDIHKDVEAVGTNDCPVTTEVLATLVNCRSGGIEATNEALIMFFLGDVVRVGTIPHRLITGLTQKVVDNLIVTFLFHLHRALVDKELLDVDAETVLIHVPCIEAVLDAELVRHGLNRLNALNETDTTTQRGGTGEILRVVHIDGGKRGKFASCLSSEFDETAFWIDLNRFGTCVEKVIADSIVVRVEGLEFIAVGTSATKYETRTAIGRIRENDAVIGINQHRHVGAVQFDFATGDRGGFATDTTRSITIAGTIVLGGTEIIDHHVSTDVITTRVAILALEEHDLTHRAVDGLNPDEVFKNR